MPQSESVCDRGDRHELVLFYSPNPACANPFPFRSSPWFLMVELTSTSNGTSNGTRNWYLCRRGCIVSVDVLINDHVLNATKQDHRVQKFIFLIHSLNVCF